MNFYVLAVVFRKNLDKLMESLFAKYRQIFSDFIVFEWDRIFESAIDKQEVKYNKQSCPNYFSRNFSKV